MRISFVGHLCIDRDCIRGELHTTYGGGVVHGSITALRLGAEATVVTKCAPSDLGQFTQLHTSGVRVVRLESDGSTSIRNDYPTENPDDRTSRLLSHADPFAAADLEAIDSDIVHINPLWFGELPCELIQALRAKVRILGADAQGFVRKVAADGQLYHGDWDEKERFLPLIDVFKADIKEAEILTGLNDVRAAAKALHKLGAATVVLTHRDGVCVVDGDDLYEAPFSGFTMEGRTGRGDTCTAAYLVARENMPPADAVRFSAETTSRKMQYRGPFRG